MDSPGDRSRAGLRWLDSFPDTNAAEGPLYEGEPMFAPMCSSDEPVSGEREPASSDADVDRPDRVRPNLVPGHLNLALVVGQMAADPQHRVLPSGDRVTTFSLTVRTDGRATTSVPVAWVGAPKRVDRWTAGRDVAVLGRIVRRFYRSGSSTGSATEVVVSFGEAVGTKGVRRLFDRARTQVVAALPG